jgi:hypothetical protein
MSRVTCVITEVDLEGDHRPVPGIMAECTKCEHTTESFGTDGASIRRCLVLMREECPLDEANWYEEEDWS